MRVVVDVDGARRLEVGDGDRLEVDQRPAGFFGPPAPSRFDPQAGDVASSRAPASRRVGQLDDQLLALADAHQVGVLQAALGLERRTRSRPR